MSRFFRVTFLLVLAASVFNLTGCFGPGKAVRIPVDMGSGVTRTIVAHDLQVPQWAVADSKRSMDFVYDGEFSEAQLQAVVGAEKACRLYTTAAHSSQVVAVLSDGVLYALAGFVGAGAGSMMFSGASFLEYGVYGAATGGAGGLAYGVISLGGRQYTFQNCARELFEGAPQFKVRVLISAPY